MRPAFELLNEDYPRPLGAAQPHRFASGVESKPLPRLIEFPIQVTNETYYRYERAAKLRMRAFVDHVLNGLYYETDGDALVVVAPRALGSVGRELTQGEVALMSWAIRDYRVAQDKMRVHRLGRVFR